MHSIHNSRQLDVGYYARCHIMIDKWIGATYDSHYLLDVAAALVVMIIDEQ